MVRVVSVNGRLVSVCWTDMSRIQFRDWPESWFMVSTWFICYHFAVIFHTTTRAYLFSANVSPGFGIQNSVTITSRLLATVGGAEVYRELYSILKWSSSNFQISALIAKMRSRETRMTATRAITRCRRESIIEAEG